jgi:hypothetical protein
MKTDPLKFLRNLTLKSGVGVYEHQGQCHRARAGLTPIGVVELPVEATAQEEKITKARAKAEARFTGIVQKALSRLRKPGPKRAPAPKKARVRTSVVSLKPDAVTFISEPVTTDATGRNSAERESERSDRVDKSPHAILHDSITLSVGKKKYLATARVRREQLDAASASTGFAIEEGHHFEPGPWALWRASLHYAPLKPKRGVHLRYVVGPSGGVVVLAANDKPLAWQLLAKEGDKEWFQALLHAFHVLDLFAVRRLAVGAVTQLSVQGALEGDRAWDELAQEIRRPIQRVAGPAYDPHLVAFGAALGALDPAKDTLNLAKHVQDPPSVLSLVPWGEVALLVVLFLGMFVSLRYYVSDAKQQLATLRERAVASAWAKNMTDAQLKQEVQKLEKEVNPLRTFVTRELYFSRGFDALSESLPSPTWLVHLSGADLIWEKSPNKALGQRYILINAGAPSQSEGAAPPEINEAVQAMANDEYLRKVLPNVKLTDVNWHREAGKSFALFSVLAMPKQK